MSRVEDHSSRMKWAACLAAAGRFSGRLCICVLVLLCSMSGRAREMERPAGSGAHPVTGAVDSANLRRSLLRAQSFGNRTTYEKQWETARWLVQELRGYGVAAALETYSFEGKPWPNVVATLKGGKRPERVVAAIAHLDSTAGHPERDGAPGADDNGSGMAVVLELARLLHGRPTARTVMLCIFGNEESGQHGSRAFAVKARRAGIDIQAVINLDVIGYGRPIMPVYADAVLLQRTAGRKLHVAAVMMKNFLRGLTNEKNAVKVVGRPADAQLVDLVSKDLRLGNALEVSGVVRKDCG